MRPPARACSSCSAVGRVISGPVIAPTMVRTMPSRRAHPSGRSVNRCFQSATATATLTNVCSRIAEPIKMNSHRSSGVEALKWLVVPRHAWRSMIATSSTNTTAVVQPTTRRMRGQSGEPPEDPRERQAVDGRRDRELERLQPGRRTGDDARIDEDAHERGDRHDQHQEFPPPSTAGWPATGGCTGDRVLISSPLHVDVVNMTLPRYVDAVNTRR